MALLRFVRLCCMCLDVSWLREAQAETVSIDDSKQFVLQALLRTVEAEAKAAEAAET